MSFLSRLVGLADQRCASVPVDPSRTSEGVSYVFGLWRWQYAVHKFPLITIKQGKIGEGEGKRIAAIGNAEAQVLQLKINSYGDPRLYAMAIVADELRQSQQPLVPSQLINFAASGEGQGQVSNMLGALLSILTTEKLGINVKPGRESQGG
ncbi:MAG: hypothetical protein ABSG68_11625 [Thermoguttaceae bacterium]|jgi:hypothetical protein